MGAAGLEAVEPTWRTTRERGAAREGVAGQSKGGGQGWNRRVREKRITWTPAETRMGRGKGNPDGWVGVVKPGRIMFELEGVDEQVAERAMQLAAAKLPIKCRFVVRANQL